MYNYRTQKRELFTDQGQRMFIAMRDGLYEHLPSCGAITTYKLMAMKGVSGDSWIMLAAIDRLVELEELREVYREQDCGVYMPGAKWHG